MNGGHVVLDTTGMVYDRAFAYFELQCEKKREERKIVARHEAASLPKSVKSQGFQGDKRVERLRHLLEHAFKDDQGRRIIRSREQRQLHEVYIRTCLPKIYQSEWEDNQERILVQYGLTKLQQESLVVMPRRSGKTWSMAMFCAAMLLVCSDIEISVFATGQRTASKLLKLMTKMLKSAVEFIGGDAFKFLQQNKEAVVLVGPDKTERTCGCYPGSVTVSPPFCVYFVLEGGRGEERAQVRTNHFILTSTSRLYPMSQPMSSSKRTCLRAPAPYPSGKYTFSNPSGTENSIWSTLT